MRFAKSFISCQILLFMCFWPGLRKKTSECPGKEPFFVFYMSTSSLVLSSNQVRLSVRKTLDEISGLGESYFPGPDPLPRLCGPSVYQLHIGFRTCICSLLPSLYQNTVSGKAFGNPFVLNYTLSLLCYINEHYNRGVNLEVKGMNL